MLQKIKGDLESGMKKTKAEIQSAMEKARTDQKILKTKQMQKTN